VDKYKNTTMINNHTDLQNPFWVAKKEGNALKSGATSERPIITIIGFDYFDTTLGYVIYWNGSNWVNSTGTTV